MTKNIPEEFNNDILAAGCIIAPEPILLQQEQLKTEQKVYKAPKYIRSLETFCKDHHYIHDTPVEKEATDSEGSKIKIFTVNVGWVEKGQHQLAAILTMDAEQKSVYAVYSSVDRLKTVDQQIDATGRMNSQSNNIQDKKFVESVRSNQDINLTDRQKLLYLKAMFEHIDNNFNKDSKNNIIILGENHESGLNFFVEHAAKLYLNKKYNVNKIGTENLITSSHKSPDGAVTYTVKGVRMGIELFDQEMNGPQKKLTNLSLIDKEVKDISDPKQKYDEREANFVSQIKSLSAGQNMICIIGAAHIIINEELKKVGKDVITISSHADLSKEFPVNYDISKRTANQANAYLMDKNMTEPMIAIDKMSYKEANDDVARIMGLYFSIEGSLGPGQQKKQSPVKSK